MPNASHNATPANQPAPALIWDTPDHFNTLSQASFDGLMIHKQGVILVANQTYADFFSIPNPETLIGCHGLDVLPFTTESKKLILQHIRSRKNDLYEISILRPDGSTAFAETQGRDLHYLGQPARLVINRDITPCKNIELALRESENKFRTLFDGAPEGILVADINSRNFVHANPAICRMLGYSEPEILHLSVMDIHPTEHLAHVITQFEVLSCGEQIRVSNIPCLRKNRSVFYADISSTLLTIAGHRTVVGFFSDNTERQQAAVAVRLSEQQLDLYSNNAGDAIYVLEIATGRIRKANARACHDLGYSSDELLKLSATDIEARLPASEVAVIHQQLRPGEVSTIEGLHKRKDGTTFPVQIRVNSLAPEQPDLMIAIVRDITEHKQAEQTQARLLTILDSTPDFVGFVNAKTQILYINPAGRKMVGIGAQEDVTRFKVDDVHPEWTNKLLREEIMPGAIRDGVWTGECAFLNRDGREIPVLMVLLAHRSPSGEVERFSTVSRDITERKRTDAQLAESRQQLRALLAKLQNLREEEQTRIAREVHDVLGQQITAFKMDNAWLARRIQKSTDEKLRMELQEKLHLTCELTDTMIESIRLISRRLRPSVLDQLGLEAALELEAREFQQRTGILCQVATPEEMVTLPPEHATGVFRVFQEMLTNVVRHARATEVSVTLTLTGGNLTLAVSDNGCGIRTQDLHNPNSLGLLGMNERAALMQGQLQICRGHKRGTTVTLIIPLTQNK